MSKLDKLRDKIVERAIDWKQNPTPYETKLLKMAVTNYEAMIEKEVQKTKRVAGVK